MELPEFFTEGTDKYHFGLTTPIKMGKKNYLLKTQIPIEIETWEGSRAGVYSSYTFSTGRSIIINNGCYVERSEFEDIGRTLVGQLASEYGGLRLQIREAKNDGDNEAVSRLEKETEELEEMFEISKAA